MSYVLINKIHAHIHSFVYYKHDGSEFACLIVQIFCKYTYLWFFLSCDFHSAMCYKTPWARGSEFACLTVHLVHIFCKSTLFVILLVIFILWCVIRHLGVVWVMYFFLFICDKLFSFLELWILNSKFVFRFFWSSNSCTVRGFFVILVVETVRYFNLIV